MENKIKIKVKKFAVKFPPIYRISHKIIKRLQGINPNQEGVAGKDLKFLLKNIGENKIVLEIGVLGGQTTRRLAKGNLVISIDPFKGDIDTGTLCGEYPEDVYKRFIKNTLGKDILLFPLTSEKAFIFWDKIIKRKILDVIFIDGLHTYEGVKIDFKWSKYLKKNGRVIFHDTHIKGVNKFIEENLLNNYQYQYVGREGFTKAFKKKI